MRKDRQAMLRQALEESGRGMRELGAVAGLLVAALPAVGQVQILNHRFEQPALPPGGNSNEVAPGWTPVGAAVFGVFYPTVGAHGYAAPECHQLLYTNAGLVEQTTAAVLTLAQTLTLDVDVVHRPGAFNQNYKVQLVAGATVIAEDAGTLTPPVGGFLVSTLVYAAQTGDPNLGQPIRIRLGGPTQCNFDNVRLNGTFGPCYADCDADCALAIDDFICFQTNFALGDPYADCDADGTLSIDDFICFQTFFAIGC